MNTTGPQRRLARARFRGSMMDRVPSRAEMNRKSERELAGLKAEIRRGLAANEQQKRKLYSALGDIQAVLAKRVNRPCR
jgi:hypothetical protein